MLKTSLCTKFELMLKERFFFFFSLPFTEISVDRFPPEVREWVRERSGKTSVPQIFFNASYIGGNEELQALVKNEERLEEALR
jgi:glutaredoxin